MSVRIKTIKFAPREARTRDLKIMTLTRCWLHHGGGDGEITSSFLKKMLVYFSNVSQLQFRQKLIQFCKFKSLRSNLGVFAIIDLRYFYKIEDSETN